MNMKMKSSMLELLFIILFVYVLYILSSKVSESFEDMPIDMVLDTEYIPGESLDFEKHETEIEKELINLLLSPRDGIIVHPSRITNKQTGLVQKKGEIVVKTSFKLLERNEYQVYETSLSSAVSHLKKIIDSKDSKDLNLQIEGKIKNAKQNIKIHNNKYAIVNIIIYVELDMIPRG